MNALASQKRRPVKTKLLTEANRDPETPVSLYYRADSSDRKFGRLRCPELITYPPHGGRKKPAYGPLNLIYLKRMLCTSSCVNIIDCVFYDDVFLLRSIW